MLAADKYQLTAQLKARATQLKEKEFNLHHQNLLTVGTQAAVLSTLNVTFFIEFAPPEDCNQLSKDVYYMVVAAAFSANIMTVALTTILSVFGTSLALRGPDGSMINATNGMYKERRNVFQTFAFGLIATILSGISAVWIHLSFQGAMFVSAIFTYSLYAMARAFMRIHDSFHFDEAESPDLNSFVSSFMGKSKGLPRKAKSSVSGEGDIENGIDHYEQEELINKDKRWSDQKAEY